MKLKSLSLALLILFSAGAMGQGNLPNAQAMFIYNFLRLVKWPDNAQNDVFTIGVFGKTQTYDQLVAFTNNRKVGTKTIAVKIISSAGEASNCQLIFVPDMYSKKIPEIKSSIGNQSCLIVSEKEGWNEKGSVIEFVLLDNKLKFKVNEQQAKQQNLTVSKALLDMAV